MKYADNIIEFMQQHPGEDFRMVAIIRQAIPPTECYHRVRIGVYRAMKALAGCGAVIIRPHRASRGGYALYRWNEK